MATTTHTGRDGHLRALTTGVPSERTLESLALGVGTVAFIGSALVALLVFRFQSAGIAGEGSIGQYAAISGAVVAFVAFVAGRYRLHERGAAVRIIDVADIAALALAHAVIALLSWTLLADILERAFLDAEVFALPVLILAGGTAAITAYIVFLSATHIDLQLLAVILAVFLVEGVVASMLTASDPHWWRENLSALGMTDDISAMAFNLTLIVAGFLVTTLARYATVSIPSTHPRGVAHVRLCLIIVGLFLGMVGVFPVDRFFAIHTGVASGMVVAFGVLVILLRVWIPGIPHTFAALGWLFLAVILVLSVLFAVGYYTLTAVELVAGILVFTWIILFMRNAAAVEVDARPQV